jgi:hypothetical protein
VRRVGWAATAAHLRRSGTRRRRARAAWSRRPRAARPARPCRTRRAGPRSRRARGSCRRWSGRRGRRGAAAAAEGRRPAGRRPGRRAASSPASSAAMPSASTGPTGALARRPRRRCDHRGRAPARTRRGTGSRARSACGRCPGCAPSGRPRVELGDELCDPRAMHATSVHDVRDDRRLGSSENSA